MSFHLDTTLIKKIEKIGLADKAAQVYVALLETGGAYPSKIAEITKINRSTVYRILVELSIKGLATEIEKRNKIYYQPEHPKNIVRFADMQITIAKNRAEDARVVLPDIESIFSLIPEKPKVRHFTGIDGIIQIYDDHISQDEPYEMLGWSNIAKLQEFLPKTYLPAYVREKQKRKITSRGILPDTAVDSSYKKTVYRPIANRFVPQFKYIPHNLFSHESEVTVYGKNCVSIINFNKKHPVGIIVEDRVIHDMLRMIFNLNWNSVN